MQKPLFSYEVMKFFTERNTLYDKYFIVIVTKILIKNEFFLLILAF